MNKEKKCNNILRLFFMSKTYLSGRASIEKHSLLYLIQNEIVEKETVDSKMDNYECNSKWQVDQQQFLATNFNN